MTNDDLINRITYHLSSGGLFNPELSDHLTVRNLLMECREALAQPEQGWIERERAVGYREGHRAALAQRTWVGLTLDERIELAQDVDWAIGAYCEYAEKIEAKLKEKNVL